MELEDTHANSKQRDQQLRRQRDLLSALHSGLGRQVAARQELRAAEDALTALYAESALFMGRMAEDRGGRRKSGDDGAANGLGGEGS